MIPAPSKAYELALPENTVRDEPKFVDHIVGANGMPKIINTAANLKELATYCGTAFRFNMMEFEVEAYEVGGDKINYSYDQLRSELISSASRFGLPKMAIEDHLIALAENNKHHPVKHWLDGGKWDGLKRVERVINCLNAKYKELANIVLKRWLVGCVASIYAHNFKSKLVPVLQGEQSYMKTAFVGRIANILPRAFLEGAELNPDNKDSVLSCVRSFIVELGELERTNKNSQGSLKAFITKDVDTIRPPYARSDIKKPRQTHFIATVNGDSFLKDETGSSRFVVLAMSKAADMDTLNSILGWSFTGTGAINLTQPELLHQFWLEVKALYDSGHGWMLTQEEQEMAKSVNDPYNDKGALYDYLRDHFAKETENLTREELNWLTAGELVKNDRKLSAHQVALIGKALKKLASEGVIPSRKGRANRTEYYLHHANRFNSDYDGFFS